MNKLNDLRFIQGQGGSGRLASGNDHISGLMFYNDSRPSAFTDNFASGGVHQIFSAADAIALGIDGTYSDETKGTATETVSAVGADGDTFEFKFTDGAGNVISLGVYTKVAADTTTTLVAAGIAAAINAGNTGTNPHGFTAVNASAVVTITNKAGLGIYTNSGTPFSHTIVGTIASTLVQNVVAGVASKIAVYFYHITRFFKMKPDASLYVGIFDEAGAADFSDLQLMQQYANGSIVQIGIWDDTQVFALAQLTQIQTQINTMKTNRKWLSSVVYAADIAALTTPLITLAGASYNLATLNAPNVSAIIDNDGSGLGKDLFYASGISITSLGACLGCIAEAAISEDIGNVIDRFNTDDGVEFDTLLFGDGSTFESISDSLKDALNNNRYIFLSKIPYTFGSYYSDDHTAVAYTSDYAWIHDNRIIDRVIKDSFRQLTPVLKSRLKLKTDGTMADTTIAYLQQLEGEVIKPLIASDDLAGDASNFDASQWVKIDITQKPNVTGKLVIKVQLVENGIAHTVEVPVGFVQSLN